MYLEAARSDEARARFREALLPLLPATFLSAVVAYELAVDARDRRTRGLVRQFLLPMERIGRIVSPVFGDWLEASDVVTATEERDRGWRSKLPALLNDILIALCARRIGATLITYNGDDFRLIRRHRGFSLRVLGVRLTLGAPRSLGATSSHVVRNGSAQRMAFATVLSETLSRRAIADAGIPSRLRRAARPATAWYGRTGAALTRATSSGMRAAVRIGSDRVH